DRTFREDLFYRLNVINIQLPPLRERREDIVPMAEFLLKKHSTMGMPVPALTPDLKHALMVYHWPGNVRELDNTIRQLIVLRNADRLARDLQAKASRRQIRSVSAAPVAPAEQTPYAMAADEPILEQVTKAKQQAETEAILAALNSTRWNRKQAAILLKVDYKALLYKMKKLGIEDKLVSFPAEPAKALGSTAG